MPQSNEWGYGFLCGESNAVPAFNVERFLRRLQAELRRFLAHNLVFRLAINQVHAPAVQVICFL
jgi:hypothetical protein